MTQRSFPVLLVGNHRRLVGELRFADNADAEVLLTLGVELRFDGMYRVIDEAGRVELQGLSIGPQVDPK